MPVPSYGVLKGRPVRFTLPAAGDSTPHLDVTIDAAGRSFRAAVNVKSKLEPSQLVFFQSLRFEHPILERVLPLAAGFTRLAARPDSGALDYIRGNLFDFAGVIALPHDRPGLDNDLVDLLTAQIQRAINDPGSSILVFGSEFPRGIHDVHMNQGNSAQFRGDDGIWQDGGLLLHFPSESRTAALFLAFQSQAIHTDDEAGNAIQGSPTFADIVRGTTPVITWPGTGTPQADGVVRIAAALINPEGGENTPGHSGRPESVTLVNASPASVQLAGWALLNKSEDRMELPAGTAIQPGGALQLRMAVPFGNSGGLITLVDPSGNKIDGVSYTAEQARREGWTIVF